MDAEGKIWDDSGRIIGRAEPLPDTEREQITSAPFEDFPDSVLDAKGNVLFEGRVIGKLVEGDPKKLEGKKVCYILKGTYNFPRNLLISTSGRRRWRHFG